jgi:N-acetylglucosamine-6-phosphate deacetylase
MAAAGAPDGAYHLGTLPVTVRDGVATLTPTDAPAAAATDPALTPDGAADPASTPDAAAAAAGTSAEGAGRASVAPTIAGSTLTQDAALRTALAAGVDPLAAVTALTATPARVLGRSDLGRLTAGHAADLVLLTPTFEVTHIWAAGRPLP